MMLLEVQHFFLQGKFSIKGLSFTNDLTNEVLKHGLKIKCEFFQGGGDKKSLT